MNDNEYNQIAEKLENSLNEKGTLIRFCVPTSLEMSFRNEPFVNDCFLARWRIKISSKPLVGNTLISYEMMLDSAIDIADLLLTEAIHTIKEFIMSPVNQQSL